MKRALLLAALATMPALSACASGPAYPPPPPGPGPAVWGIAERINWVQQRINRGWQMGYLDRGEYYRVQSELNNVRREFNGDRAANGGYLDPPTRADLENRLNGINAQIHWLHAMNEQRPW